MSPIKKSTKKVAAKGASGGCRKKSAVFDFLFRDKLIPPFDVHPGLYQLYIKETIEKAKLSGWAPEKLSENLISLDAYLYFVGGLNALTEKECASLTREKDISSFSVN